MRFVIQGRWFIGVLLCLWHFVVMALPPVQTWQTRQGAWVYFLPAPELPMVDIQVNVRAGSGRDHPAQAGLAALTQQLLSAGAGKWDEAALADGFADVGSQWSSTIDEDRAQWHLRSLTQTESLTRSVDLLAAILQAPTFPAAIVKRERDLLQQQLREAATKPDYLAERAFEAAVYGTHPYGISPTPDSVASLNREAVLAFYRQYYRAGNVVIALVGAISRAQAENMAERLSAHLPTGASPALPSVARLTHSFEQRIPHPATQVQLLMGQSAIDRANPDYFPLLVANYVLGGGGFSARLTEEIRQRRGLSYSVYSYFEPLAAGGIFRIGLQTQANQADAALAVVRQVVMDWLQQGVSDAELAQAKAHLIGSFPLRIDSNRKQVDYLSLMGIYGLSPRYLAEFQERVQAVSRAQIQQALVRNLSAQHWVVVMVGNMAKSSTQANPSPDVDEKPY